MKPVMRFVTGFIQCCAWVLVVGCAAIGLQLVVAMATLGKYAIAWQLLRSFYN